MAGEAFGFAYKDMFGLDFRVVRPSAPYGFAMGWPMFVKPMVEDSLRGRPVRFETGGPFPRSYTHIEDVASITEPGDGLVKIASTGTVVAVLAEPRPDPRILTYPHLDGRWYTLTATNAAAAAYQWLHDSVIGSVPGSLEPTYVRMDEIAGQVPPGADGVMFLPFLTGERSPYWDAELRAAFLGLSAAHRQAHLCRAVLDGVAFSLRDCRDLLASLDVHVARPYFTGGGIRSHLLRSAASSISASFRGAGLRGRPQHGRPVHQRSTAMR